MFYQCSYVLPIQLYITNAVVFNQFSYVLPMQICLTNNAMLGSIGITCVNQVKHIARKIPSGLTNQVHTYGPAPEISVHIT